MWPEKVLRAIGQDSVQACEDLPECTSVTATPLDGIRIPTGSEVDPWITADALITPDRTRELRAGCFEKLAEDVVYRHMLAIATIEWLATGPGFIDEIPLLRNASEMAQLLGMDPASDSVLQFMFLVTHLEPLQATLCTIPCVSMGAAISMLTRWVGTGERASIEALFSVRGVLVPLGLHKGVETSTVDLFDAMMLRDAQMFARFMDESRSHAWDASRLLPVASSSSITLEELPHLQAVHQLNSALLANSSARKLEGTHFLLHGVSGAGKTSYARLLAQDANLRLYEISPTSTVNGNIRPYKRVELLIVNAQADQKTPMVVRRSKLTGKVDLQIALAKAQTEGADFAATRKKTVIDRETGLKKRVDAAMTVRPWWWTNQAGAVVLGLRYGSKPIEIAKGKNAIEVGSIDNLVDTLLAVREAIVTGELDAQIEAASGAVRAGFKKK